MKHFPLFFLAVIHLFLIRPALADEPAQLKAIRFDFQVKLAEMIKPLRELDGKYAAHLEKQKQGLQDAGKLKAMLAVEEEIKWLKDKPVEENPSSGPSLSAFPELKHSQEIYRKQWSSVENNTASPDGRLALIQMYKKKAGDLAIEWTKAGKIDEAKLALAESERFAAMEKDAELAAKAVQVVAFGSAQRTGSMFAGKKAGEKMENGIKMKLCWIPAGKFTMGSSEREPERGSNEAQVEVALTTGFWMGKYEVTQEEYEKITGSNPSMFADMGDRAPVEQINWDEAMAFCGKLSERERKRSKLPDGWAYTLPTEAQWEYACRAGESGPYSGGELDEVGWYKDNSGGKTHEVGGKKGNAWGLHDVHGNVREWCLDWMEDKLLGGSDTMGPTSGSLRVHRGGDWNYKARDARAAHRYGTTPTTRRRSVGFRVCVSPTGK